MWVDTTRKYYPSSNQFRDPPTYTHQPSMQQKVPFSLIRCSSSKVAFCSCVEWGWHIYNIVESESDPLTRRAVDLFEKEPLKGNSEVHLHTPTKFGEDRSKDLGGDREQTDRQTNRQTDKRCSIYSMIMLFLILATTTLICLTTHPYTYICHDQLWHPCPSCENHSLLWSCCTEQTAQHMSGVSLDRSSPNKMKWASNCPFKLNLMGCGCDRKLNLVINQLL